MPTSTFKEIEIGTTTLAICLFFYISLYIYKYMYGWPHRSFKEIGMEMHTTDLDGTSASKEIGMDTATLGSYKE